MTSSIVKLGDVATYYNGYAFKPSDRSPKGRRIVRIQDLTGSSYETNYFSGQLPDKFAIQRGDVLISWSASLGVYVWNDEPAWLNQHIFKVGFNKLQVNKSFFVHQIDYLLKASSDLAHGATMRHLTKNTFASLPFRYPDPTEQLRIANVLDKTDLLLHSCSNVLEKLDSLIKSRFTEMFGDPCNPKDGKGRSKLDSFCELRIGPFGSVLHKEDYITGGHPLVNPSHIVRGTVRPDNALTISEEKYKSLAAYHLRPGDVVLGRRGEIGRCAVVDKNGMICGTGSMIIRPGQKVRSGYLQRVVSFPSFSHALESNAVGVTMKNLNAKIVGSTEVYLPKLAEQDAFIDFASQVDKLRFDVQQQIERLETLKKSIMQEYFG